MNVSMLLEMTAEVVGDRVAVVSDGARLTYADLLERAAALGGHLRAGGRDAVATLDESSAALPALLFGAAAGGVPFVPLNYRLSDHQLQDAVDELGSVACLVGPDHAGRLPARAGVEILTRHDVLRLEREGQVPPGAAPEDAAVWLFTSGTSGPPKIVVLRHQHLASYVLSSVEFLSASEDEAILVSVPPYHIAGISTILTSVYAGRRMVQLPTFTPQGWVAAVRDEGVTQAMVVPTMLNRILDTLEEGGETLPTLRHLAYGGGRMPRPVVERALRLLPDVDFVNAYGLTETASTIAVLGPQDHRDAIASDDPTVRRRLGSVGRPVPDVELEIRDADGAPVGPGVPGEIHVRGPQVSGEYRSHRVLDPDGWFPTRDHGWLDDGGYLHLEGRADDVIVRGAENLSPGEIEDALVAHPSVSDAAVVGVPDLEWGERVEAVVVLAPNVPFDEDGLREFVRGQLRSSKTPAHVHVVDELPRNDLGKLLRAQVRAGLSPTRSAP